MTLRKSTLKTIASLEEIFNKTEDPGVIKNFEMFKTLIQSDDPKVRDFAEISVNYIGMQITTAKYFQKIHKVLDKVVDTQSPIIRKYSASLIDLMLLGIDTTNNMFVSAEAFLTEAAKPTNVSNELLVQGEFIYETHRQMRLELVLKIIYTLSYEYGGLFPLKFNNVDILVVGNDASDDCKIPRIVNATMWHDVI